PSEAILEPNPVTENPPHGFVWPIAPTYTCSKLDRRYRRGYFYYTTISSQSNVKIAEIDRLSRIANPPGISPAGYDAEARKFLMDPIQGMIQLPVGIPLVALVDGEPTRSLTMTCLHTLKSVLEYWEGPRIVELSNIVWDNMWGTNGSVPFFKLDGLKVNARSQELKPDRADASYTLASTKEEGKGNQGPLHPGVQSHNPEYLHRSGSLFSTIHEIIGLVVPLCLSKLEWDVWMFRGDDLNVMTFGGLRPGLTGLQFNCSSENGGGFTLRLSIGAKQGYWHVDFKDAAGRWTLLIIMLQLPPGSNAGDFLQARCGAYARVEVGSDGRVMFYLVIKGNDLHCSTSPSVHAEALHDFIAFLNEKMRYSGCENRAVLVNYPNHAAFYKDSPCAIWEDLGFGNRSMVPESFHSYIDEGFPLLGSFDDYKNRIWRENYMMSYNASRELGIEPSRERPSYINLAGESVQMLPLPFDPEFDAIEVHRLRSMAFHLEETSSLYLLSMTKPMFREAQNKAREDN
ncbi:hypothetical protein C8J56DRAFT_760267, partial [Mycena floridula]